MWALGDPDRLSAKARAAILDERNELFVSHALKSHAPPTAFPGVDVLEEALRQVGVHQHLPISLAHILGTTTLPAIHRDPFDRLLISQARSEGLTRLSRHPRPPVPNFPALVGPCVGEIRGTSKTGPFF